MEYLAQYTNNAELRAAAKYSVQKYEDLRHEIPVRGVNEIWRVVGVQARSNARQVGEKYSTNVGWVT